MNEQTNKQNNLLLSLALFKKLYDEGMDIYEILSSFVKCELENQTVPFSLTNITSRVNKEYNFNIPQAIIQTSLKRLKKNGILKVGNGKYEVIQEIFPTKTKNDVNLAKQQKQSVLNKIKEYLDNKNIRYGDIEASLENYILNRSDSLNTHIDACIITNSTNKNFVNALNEIKYGLVLYEGISYGIENINPEKWNRKTIFLDTEILFYLGGYQGELFQRIANDFFSLIKITNKNKKVITLRFLKSTDKQIQDMFYVAESIISKKKQGKPNDVVNHILDSCKGGEASDIINKKTEFYHFLCSKGIKVYEYNIDYSDTNNHKYNLSNNQNGSFNDKDIIYKEQLSTVSILRGNNTFCHLDKINFLFVTQTQSTINFSVEYKKENGGFPLALRLFDITNQLWVKTNKGLSNDSLPATFDIRNKAKIALSHSLMKKVCEEHEKVIQNNQNIDENLIIDQVAELRRLAINPDNINEKNCGEIEDIIINPEEFNKYYEEKAFYKSDAEEKTHIISKQERELTEKNREIENLKKGDIDRKIKIKKVIKKILCYISVVGILIYHKKNIYKFLQSLLQHPIAQFIAWIATILTIYNVF